jgi:hypothetical protein
MPDLPFYRRICPACGETAEAEFVDNGVGMERATPFHCWGCGWNEDDEDADPHNIVIVTENDEPSE